MRFHLRSGGWMRFAMVLAVLAGGIALVSSEKPVFTERDKAFYADEALINFVRPGLVFKVQSVQIGADGTVKVRFSMTDPRGVGLDRDGIVTPGTVSSSFILSKIPKGGRYHQSYTTRIKTSTYPPTAGKQAKQAAADTGGRYEKVSDGVYDYTFGYKLPSTYEKDAAHTVGIYGNRNLTEFEMGVNYASTVYNFMPDNSAMKEIRDVISTSSCNKCHTDLAFHGGSRKGMEMCILCHAPAYSDVTNLNPETNNTIDMTAMTHKIHMGSNLPSVQAGKPYQIVGFGNAVADFSYVNLPSEPVRCYFCHETKNTAAQVKNWMTKPGRDACGACHDNIDWTTGKGHYDMPQPDDQKCTVCHIPQGEIDFDASVKGAHTHEFETSLISGLNVEIKSVENGRAGQKPVVNFTIKDNGGNVWPMANLDRCALVLSGPTAEYVKPGTTGYVSEDCKAANPPLTGDTYKYTFNTTIPTDAKGSWSIGSEARVFEKVLVGTMKEREIEYAAVNKVVHFSVDGSAVVPRRAIVSQDTCNGCHAFLSLHGTNRNRIEQCVLCHNPLMTDAARRPAAQMPAEAIDMNLMTHRIHAGEEQNRPYVLYGRGGAVDFSKVVFIAGLNTCSACHINNTHTVVPANAPEKRVDPRGYLNPTYSTTGACLSCHTSKDAASHALANTTTLGESCGACHGPNRDYAVAKVHAE